MVEARIEHVKLSAIVKALRSFTAPRVAPHRNGVGIRARLPVHAVRARQRSGSGACVEVEEDFVARTLVAPRAAHNGSHRSITAPGAVDEFRDAAARNLQLHFVRSVVDSKPTHDPEGHKARGGAARRAIALSGPFEGTIALPRVFGSFDAVARRKLIVDVQAPVTPKIFGIIWSSMNECRPHFINRTTVTLTVVTSNFLSFKANTCLMYQREKSKIIRTQKYMPQSCA